MKNKMKKRILAASMALVAGVGLTGVYEYSHPAVTVYAEEEKEVLKEAAEEMLGDSDTGSTGEIFKDESVYVKADASGKVKDITVTEWLKNPGAGEEADVSELSDIKNIKGEETFTKGNDGALTWQSEGEDIYYQGTTKKELPVDVRISYKLNGKEISAEELNGKDGKVEIHISYTNKAKQTVSIGGENVEMYTPFAMVTALMLPTEEYKNVTIDHGKIISDADKDIVVGIAFPGLEENLKLQEIDLDIPQSVTITADVKNASVGPTITVASADVISKLGLDEIDSFDDLEDSIDELDDAATQLAEGSKEASDGAARLADGSRELSDGAVKLAEGNQTLAGGVNTLNNKSGDLIKGVSDLADGINQYTMGVEGLAQGSEILKEGAKSVNDGAAQVRDGAAGAKAGADELAAGLQSASSQVTGVVGNISAGLKGVSDALGGAQAALGGVSASADVTVAVNKTEIVNAAMNAISSDSTLSSEQKAAIKAAIENAVPGEITEKNVAVDVKGLEQVAGYLSGAQGGIGQIQNGINEKLPALNEGMKGLNDGAAALQGGLGSLAEGSKSLAAGTDELLKGAGSLADGAATLNKNSNLLTGGTLKLQQGGSQLKEGVRQLADGANAASAGANALKSGAAQVADGSQALAEGNQTLADGMSEFKTSGIDKLTELFNGDIKNLTDRIDAMTLLGENYKSFAGIKEGVKGSTKFIIETE